MGGSVIYSQKTALLSLQEGTAKIGQSDGSDLLLPFDNTGGAVTSMAVTNPGNQTAHITVNIRYTGGGSETIAYPAIAGRTHQAFPFTSAFPNSAAQSGVAGVRLRCPAFRRGIPVHIRPEPSPRWASSNP